MWVYEKYNSNFRTYGGEPHTNFKILEIYFQLGPLVLFYPLILKKNFWKISQKSLIFVKMK
jgi:hypothetical protein